jgi:peptidoglycan hydrolase-like protein with peptidoglycan-binding domain
MQRRLKDRGWFIGVDGVFGRGTQEVVKWFQDNERLPVTGAVDSATWKRLWAAPTGNGFGNPG